jgi:MoxR-like ATPase
MREGGFLYIEEFNRAPDDTLNTLLTAMAERQVTVPRVGTTTAKPTFRVIASMNPYDNVGTVRLSTSISDRLCRLSVDYQDDAAERGIVALRTGLSIRDRLVADAVAVTRATRLHPDVRQGSSVRGAIDTALVATEVSDLRAVSTRDDERYPQVVFDAMTVALSGRIQLDEAAETTPELVLRQIWEDRFLLGPRTAAPG